MSVDTNCCVYYYVRACARFTDNRYKPARCPETWIRWNIYPSVLFDRKNTFEVIKFVGVLNIETGEQESQDLEFLPVTWSDYERIYPYTSAYGEGSCQHSPVSMASRRSSPASAA